MNHNPTYNYQVSVFIITRKLQELVTPFTMYFSSEKAPNPARKPFTMYFSSEKAPNPARKQFEKTNM